MKGSSQTQGNKQDLTPSVLDTAYALDDRYRSDRGQVYLNGMQALVRLLLMQSRRDRAAGVDTAGFVSGYRGSPIGTLDLALWQARSALDEHRIRFEPGLNEDLAATAIRGTQQAALMQPTTDGVFGLWYGKGPGVDRSCDALKHGNYAGCSRHGGVLVVAGDDPGAKSSSLPHQSELALIHCGIPVLAPADLQELLDLGQHGWAMSRHSGCWIGLKCVTDLLDSSGTVDASMERVQPLAPDGGGDRWIGWGKPALALEKSLHAERLPAAQHYARANALDRVVFGARDARLGIVAAGKTSADVLQALVTLGIDAAEADRIGLAVYKPALVWPLEPEALGEFARTLERLLVVEEKRPILEEQIATLLYAAQHRPELSGKRDAHGNALLALDGELDPDRVAAAIAQWLERAAPATASLDAGTSSALMRTPAFCSGCPHNTSTRVPEGSQAMAGIGCHGMALMLPERHTLEYTHMGGEGANWIGLAPFSHTPHVFQNMGDGTYQHSGLLAIRAAVAAGVSITYKILVNGAVAMTGGQPIEGHGPLDIAGVTTSIARQLLAEGVANVVVVTDDPQALSRGLPHGVSVHHRDELDRIQRDFREIPGVSAILYDQACAAEKRRLRKRGQLADPERRLFIHESVCEGCGDCSVQSNCIAVEPLETELGRKRAINQDACNKDYSCLKGYCPSFAVLDGARLKRRNHAGGELDALLSRTDLPPPAADGNAARRILITGIGGTGVVTLGALLGMAAHLEGRACRVLDQTGAAQKNGAVASHVQIADSAQELHATRIAAGSADVVLGCDLVTAAGSEALLRMARGRTQVIVNHDVAPTAQFASRPDLDLGAAPLEARIDARVGDANSRFIAATTLARRFLGDELGVNMLLLGVALQRGLLGVSVAALERAIELNGSRVEFNKRALRLGRLIGHDPDAVARAAGTGMQPLAMPLDWKALAERRAAFLVGYQDAAYAERYRRFVAAAAEREAAVAGHAGPLALAIAQGYFKLLAVKDEYEVARLWTGAETRARLDAMFEPGYRVKLSLAPQLPWAREDADGRIAKRLFGPWIFQLFRLLAALRRLRGTPLDLVNRHPHRRRERALAGEYEQTMQSVLARLSRDKLPIAIELARLPESIRGYGGVKERNMAEAAQRRAGLLARFEATSSAQAAA